MARVGRQRRVRQFEGRRLESGCATVLPSRVGKSRKSFGVSASSWEGQ